MRLLSVFRKSVREQLRDPLALSLSLVFAPVFVLLYAMWFPSGSTSYSVLVLNQDVRAQTVEGTTLAGGEQVIAALEQVKYANGNPLLKVSRVNDRADAERLLKNRDAAALLIIPANFSQTLAGARQGDTTRTTSVTLVGDLTNPYYALAAALTGGALDQYVQLEMGETRTVQWQEEALGGSAARSEFENYVPGLLAFATMMLMFTMAMAVTREVEARTLRRLQITRMTSFDLLGGISGAIVLIGFIAVVSTFLVAWALGFKSQGPIGLAILIGVLTTFSVIGVGLIIACFSRSVTQAFLLANFPLALFMFFSGAVLPMPRVALFELAGHSIGPYDILPPTHAVIALNKVLALGEGLGDIWFEMTALLLLSAVYFGAGVWLFQRMHLRAA